MPRNITHWVFLDRPLLIVGLVITGALAGGCRAQGPYITHATIEWPGATLRQLDESVAKPVGQRLFASTNGVVEVTSISSAGKVDLYATSDGLARQHDFVQAISGSLTDAADTLPRGAAAGFVELLPKGEAVPEPPVHPVDKLRIDIDRAKLIDAGLSYDDVSRAVAKAREQEIAFLPPASGPTTAPAVRHMIDVLDATILPSRDKPVTLGEVAHIHVVPEPDVIERHWP
jgi:multidrug efflux pump subunit AcrB